MNDATMTTPFVGIVLAAGMGTRMKSRLSKVLHPVAGRPLLEYPIRAVAGAGASRVVVVASPANAEGVREAVNAISDIETSVAIQDAPRGTGDAARAALSQLPDAGWVCLINGDPPLIRDTDIRAFREGVEHPTTKLAILSCELEDPTGYGRVLRDTDGAVSCVREQKDLASDAERAVQEVNAGMYLVEATFLRRALGRLRDDNAQGEFYLTDIVEQAAAIGAVEAIVGDPAALEGINDRAQLHNLEALLYARIREGHRRRGVTIRSEDVLVDPTVSIEPDVVLESGVSLRGNVSVGKDTHIDRGCVITDSRIGANVYLKPYCVLQQANVEEYAQVGPFAHLRPGSDVGPEARVGNFVELKKTRLGKGAKANHLAYLGDGEVGDGANIGAGTIFCNYDGYNKAKTVIGAGAFIGSDSQLVAPVTVGKGAYVATGSSVTEDVPPNSLAISRGRQTIKAGYAEQLRQKLMARKAAAKS